MNAKHFLIIVLLCGLIQSAHGQERNADSAKNFLEIIPINASVGLAWPKVTELGPKAFKLAQEVYPGSGQFIRSVASSFFNDAGIDYNAPEFSQIIDRANPAAMFGVKTGSDYSPVNVIPIGNPKKLAEMLQVDLVELKSGKIIESTPRLFLMLAGEFIYTSHDREALAQVKPAETIDQFIAQGQHGPLLKSDAVLFLDYAMAVDFQSSFLEMFGDAPWQNAFGDADSTNELVKLIADSSQELAFGLVGIELDGGLGFSYTNFFHETKDSHAQRLIKAIRGGDGVSNLDHLPNGDLVAAFAATGNGSKNVTAARAFLKSIVDHASPGEEILSADDKQTFYQSFSNLWRQLNGSRVAVYRIQNPLSQDGSLAAVAILDVEDPQKLMAQIPELAKFANESAERNSVTKGLLPIRFNYTSAASRIRDLPVDFLTVDTDRLDEETRRRTRVLFGQQAGQIKFVAVKSHLLIGFGTHTDLLEQAIDNLANGNVGLKTNLAIANANLRLDERRKIEAHLSFPNLLDLYTFKEQPQPFQSSDQVSSFALTLEPKRVGIDAWLPAKEIDAAVDWSLLFW